MKTVGWLVNVPYKPSISYIHVGHGLWAVGSETRYVRMLSSACASVSSLGIGNHKKIAPRWQTNETTLHLVLATAYNAARSELVEGPPTAWWSSR